MVLVVVGRGAAAACAPACRGAACRAGRHRGRAERRSGDVLFTARDLVTPGRLWLAVVLTIPVLLLTYVPALGFPGWQWVSLVLATPVVLWGGWPFISAAWRALRRGEANMMTLIATGILVIVAVAVDQFARRRSQ